MSFSAVVKEELAGLPLGSDCCRLAELAGLTLAAGAMHISSAGMRVEMTTESPAIARRIYKLIKSLYQASPQMEQHERRRLNRNISYRVALTDNALASRMLADIGVLGRGEVDIGIKPSLVRLSCCQGAFLRGLLLGCGTISDPGKAYSMEFVLEDERLARSAASLLAGADVEARVVERRGRHVAYIKDANDISDILAFTGAHAAMLRFESIRVEKGVRNTANRLVNCDTANADKTVWASVRQVEDIRLIERTGGLHGLPAALREAARARLESPDATLEALAGMGGISKSGLYHRMRRLREIAEEIKHREGIDDEAEEAGDTKR
jgi:DNA-binding protein WhiA